MRNISENDRKIWISDIAHKEYKMTISDGNNAQIFLNDGINEESIKISEVWEDSAQLSFTGCHAKVAKVTLQYVGADKIGKSIVISAKATAYGTTTAEMVLFTGTIDEITQNGNDDIVSTITARDVMANAITLDVAEWYKSITFPITLQALADSLKTYLASRHIALISADLPLGDEVVEETINPQNLALKDVLTAIATMNGMYCVCDVNNNICFKALTKLDAGGLWPAEDLFPADDLYPMEPYDNASDGFNDNEYKSLMYQNYDVATIDKVICREDSDDVGAIYGTGTNAYIIEGNFLLYGKDAAQMAAVAERIYALVNGIVYTPAKVVGIARPWLECGDLIRVYSKENVIYTYILERTFNGLQAAFDTYESRQDETREEQVTGVNTSILQLRGKANKLTRDIDHLSSAIYDDDGNSRIDQNASAIEAKVSKGDVSSQLSIESGQITLDTGRLIISSGNFQIDADGKIKATEAELSGKITATSGEIANFKIRTNAITTATSTNVDITNINTGVYMGTDGIAVMSNGFGFRVKSSGEVLIKPSATNALIIGSISSNHVGIESDGDTYFGSGASSNCVLINASENNKSIEIKGSTTSTKIEYNKMTVPAVGFTLQESNSRSALAITSTAVMLGSSNITHTNIGGTYLQFFASTNGSGSTAGAIQQKVPKLAASATLSTTIAKVNDLLDALNAYSLIKL